MNTVKKFILEQLSMKHISQTEAVNLLAELQQNEKDELNEIAVIGVANRLPMSKNSGEYWDNLVNGRLCFVPKPEDKLVYDEMILKNIDFSEYIGYTPSPENYDKLEQFQGGYITDWDKFDAAFFGIPPREARYIEPEQRVFMEAAVTAIEDAGYSIPAITNSKMGVFVGKDQTNSIHYKYLTEDDQMKLSGFWSGILASRISYTFNLKGPAFVLDTACSSGLVAIHEACSALRNQECDMALAGGINLGIAGQNMQDIDNKQTSDEDMNIMDSVQSTDYRVRTFDKKCSGTVFSEGVVVFLLKPLKNAIKDGDHIYGVIKGSSVNNDGASNGITAPNPLAQEEVIIDAWKRANVSPESISYVETHGTGTLLGDPIEVTGLSNAFSRFTDKKQFCGIGSVKTNIGHSVGAAGPANLLKVLLSMKHRMLPPSLHFEETNPYINFINSPLYVVDKCMNWDSGEMPLRAGISAFGFSGTNCHLIVEEYKEPDLLPAPTSNNVLSLSAKTETALKSLIHNYEQFLENEQNIPIGNLCYTANTGRGHYTYRIAIVFNTLKDLREKLAILNKNDLKNMVNHGIYYGKNQVVSDKRQSINEGEILISELNRITQEAQNLVLTGGDVSENVSQLSKLCELYVKGATVDWKHLYQDGAYKRVSLPTYPFDRTHYWAEPATVMQSIRRKPDTKILHPLVHHCIVDSMKQSVYLINPELAKEWVITDHKLMGTGLLVGTAFLEMIKEACQHCFNNANIVIQDLVFMAPLLAYEGDRDIHIVITHNDVNAEFSFVSRQEESTGDVWIEHCKGTVCMHDDTPPKQLSFSEIESDPAFTKLNVKQTSEEKEVFYSNWGSDNYFGERWNSILNFFTKANGDRDEVITELQISDKYLSDLDHFSFHPALVDDAINVPVIRIYSGGLKLLPLSYKNLKFYRRVPNHFYSKIALTKDTNTEVFTFRASLVDMSGNLIAEAEEVTLRQISKMNEFNRDVFYGMNWMLQSATIQKTQNVQGNILVFCDHGEYYARALAERIQPQPQDSRLFFVSIGKEFSQIDETHFTVGEDEEDYDKLLAAISVNLCSVYHFSTVDFTRTDVSAERYGEELHQGLYSVVYLTRALLRTIRDSVDFVLLTDYAHEVTGEEACVKPAHAAFLAVTKSTAAEYPNLRYRCIDIDEATDMETVLDEVMTDNPTFRVAYRNNQRFTEALTVIEQKQESIKRLEIKQTGFYFITGGTGGLGLQMAIDLGNKGAQTICLLARKALPDRSTWQTLLSDGDRKLKTLIESILYLENLGCTILLRYADVSDMVRMESILSELKAAYGPINGIIHCAGMAGDGFLFNKNMNTFRDVIRPKIDGTVVLDALTKGETLDFFILFSSMTSLLGGPGQSDYTAANAFLDAYATYLRKKGIPALTVNWPGWSEVGMAVDYQVADAVTLFRSLETEAAIQALNEIIKYDLSNVIPGQINYDVLQQIGENNLPFKLSAWLKKNLDRHISRHNTKKKQVAKQTITPEDVHIIGKNDNYTTTENEVAFRYAIVLDLREIDIYESFNSLGGDSIHAMELLKEINAVYPRTIDITDIFTHSSVEELAGLIDKKRGIGKDQSDDKAFIVPNYELSDDDIMSMLDNVEQGNVSSFDEAIKVIKSDK
ncbi:SDR family NAD(P)-dependent oxidoreductase [Paenibacillus alvei]|uniref:SDR family NAD(P)-dependent oxidoreductase n=1 Tax=Paenibacillus alvei TaxID=44250 RepID=A0ABT4GZB5_PAEAL|nr:SDR family NAD(P)-dependent oxidoreductase [Paenibacillus alvei]MCY7487873.1 SDR family NAD(P)-dependent oxidoreductase [Paenibacillus alvei]MCY9762061.1 SDR family NAD(P)-dependent oxidoreductase [Paenibacillus alvei]MCY9770086.1 SDR family NAD(P)-dependent oxidoreductase [Paenibacillus alvei]